jgi:hypothetical protein
MKSDEAPWTDKQAGPYLDRDKLDALYSEFRKIATERFGVDCDGDLPLDIHLVDRTRYERSHYSYVPYDHKVATENEHDTVLMSLTTNLAIASDAVARWYRCLQYNPRPATARDENLSSENRQLVERNKTVEGELNHMRREHGLQIRKDETVKSARAQRDRAVDALNHLFDCKVKKCAECETHKENNRLDGKKPRKKKAAAP